MFEWFFKNKKRDSVIKVEELNLSVLTLDEVNMHFNACEHNDSLHRTWFRADDKLLEDIKSKIIEGRKNIFILDDVCELTDILYDELIEQLTRRNIIDNCNVIPLCTLSVGFDMLSILALTDIKVDFLLTDITFGGNRVINGKNTILDGVDTLIITKEKFPDCNYLIFTGNILSEVNIRHYNFSKKFERYMHESILPHVIHKDTVLNFEHDNNIIFEKICKVIS